MSKEKITKEQLKEAWHEFLKEMDALEQERRQLIAESTQKKILELREEINKHVQE